MILCVNPNASIDKTLLVSPFHLNEIHRTSQVKSIPGGKGCNVARALKTLAEPALLTGWVGGFAGQFIETNLQREGIPTRFVYTEAESRMCTSILDSESNTLTEVYEQGEPVSAEHIESFFALFTGLVGQHSIVTLSGSLPPGVPAGFYADLVQICKTARVPVLLDASGEALRLGLAAQPSLIKPNQHEFAALIGRELPDTASICEAARQLSQQHGTIIVVSLGADGALIVKGDDAFHAQPPPLEIKSAVGSGDSLVAGMAAALSRGYSLETVLQYGVAAGTANALQIGAGVFSREDFDRILPQVLVKRL